MEGLIRVPKVDAQRQLLLFKELLTAADGSLPPLELAVNWLRTYVADPQWAKLSDDDVVELRTLLKQAYEIDETELQRLLAGPTRISIEPITSLDAKLLERELWSLIPEHGLLYRYCLYTSRHEAPLAYHLFSILVAIGAILANRVWLPFGDKKLYPNLAVILLGPSGLKKSSAADVAMEMLQELELTKVYSEQITPQALVEAMASMPQGVIYAPEMSVFLGKQKYMEGIVPLITRLLDCPSRWSSERVTRTTIVLRDVAPSALWCTNAKWFIENTPEDTFSGGFIPRHILVIQEDTARLEAFPGNDNPQERANLMGEMAALHRHEGQVSMTKIGREAYVSWYREHKSKEKASGHELIATSLRRKPTTLLRLWMCLHIAEHHTLVLCEQCLFTAVRLLDWVERFVPGLIEQMFRSEAGADQEFILKLIYQAGGMIDHTVLVRRAQYRMNALQVRSVINSLKDAKQVRELHDNIQHTYIAIGGAPHA